MNQHRDFALLSAGLAVANDVVAFDAHHVLYRGTGEQTIVWEFEAGPLNGVQAMRVQKLIEQSAARFLRHPRKLRAKFRTNGHAAYLFPIKGHRRSLGWILVERSNEEFFSTFDTQLLESVGRLVGQALIAPAVPSILERLHLFFLDHRTSLQDATKARAVLDTYLAKLEGVCHPEYYHSSVELAYQVLANAKLINSNGMALYMRAFRPDNSTRWPDSFRSLRYATHGRSSLASRVFETGKSYRTNNYQRDSPHEFRLHRDVRGHISAPIRSGASDTKYGVLTIEATGGPNYTSAHEDAVRLLAAHAARPLGRALDRELALRRSNDAAIVTRAMAKLHRSESWTRPDIQDELSRWLIRLGYRRGLFCRVDRTKELVIGDRSWGPQMDVLSSRTRRHFHRNRGDCQIKCVLERHPQVVADPIRDFAAHRDGLRVAALGPFAILPFMGRDGEVHWTVHVEREDVAPLAAVEVDNLMQLCRMATVVLERAAYRTAQSHQIRLDRLAIDWADSVQMQYSGIDHLLGGLSDFITRKALADRCMTLLASPAGWELSHFSERTDSVRNGIRGDLSFPYPAGGTASIHRRATKAILVRGHNSTNTYQPAGYRVFRQPESPSLRFLKLGSTSEWVELPIKRDGVLYAVVILQREQQGDVAYTAHDLRLLTDLAQTTSLAVSRLAIEELLLRESLFAASMATFRHEVVHSLLRLRDFPSQSLNGSRQDSKATRSDRLKVLVQSEIQTIETFQRFFQTDILDLDDSTLRNVTISNEIDKAIELLPSGRDIISAPKQQIGAMVRGARRPLCLILLQLLSNALNAVDGTNHPNIRVRYRVQANPRRHRITVCDNGHGFTSVDFRRISQIDRPLDTFRVALPSGRSFGTGLFYARLIAHRLGWALKLLARKDPTTWEIDIPF